LTVNASYGGRSAAVDARLLQWMRHQANPTHQIPIPHLPPAAGAPVAGVEAQRPVPWNFR
jgi:hypothetical protein